MNTTLGVANKIFLKLFSSFYHWVGPLLKGAKNTRIQIYIIGLHFIWKEEYAYHYPSYLIVILWARGGVKIKNVRLDGNLAEFSSTHILLSWVQRWK